MSGDLITPRDFTTNVIVPERMFGTETEYSARRPDGSVATATEWRNDFLSPKTLLAIGNIATFTQSHETWLSNGAEMHPDVEQLEYCTPESLGPLEATATSHGGMRLLQYMAAYSGSSLQLFRRAATVDAQDGTIFTQGHHVNLCIPLEVATRQRLKPLETHLATMFYGSNGIATMHDGFNISPKAHGIGGGITDSMKGRTSVTAKPMAIVRRPDMVAQYSDNDVNNPADGFGRLELRCLTPSTRWSDFMAMGTTSILLRAVEHHELADERAMLEDLALEDSVVSLKRMNLDTKLLSRHRLASGEEMSVLDIQDALAGIAESISEKIQLPEDELLCLREWQAICTDAREVAEGRKGLGTIQRIGWVAKYGQLLKKFGEDRTDKGSIDVRTVCLNYDKIAPRGPVYETFERRFVPELISDETIESYVTNPPTGTRAAVRGEYIRRTTPPYKTLDTIAWPWVRFKQAGYLYVDRMHPYQQSPGTPEQEIIVE